MSSKRISTGLFHYETALIAIASLAIVFFVVRSASLADDPPGNPQTQPSSNVYPILSSCSGSTLFSADTKPIFTVSDQDRVDDWIEEYHENVSKIVQAHLEKPQVECAAADAREKPGDDLKAIAADLPPWSGGEDFARLSELDMSAVLLEYLRLYECSLKEEQFNLGLRVAVDLAHVNFVHVIGTFTEELGERGKKIDRELGEARAALDRTLAVTGSIDRLKPLDTDIECLQRSSLDIRNVLGLSADVSACLPRVWDARGSLRDLPEKEETASSETP